MKDKICSNSNLDNWRVVYESFHAALVRLQTCEYHILLLRKSLDNRSPAQHLVNVMQGSADSFDFEVSVYANTVAAMQAIHSIADVVGQALLHSILPKINGQHKKAYLKDAVKKYKDHKGNLQKGYLLDVAGCERLIYKVLAFLDAPDFEYLTDFVNRSKHRSIINIPRRFEFDSMERVLVFDAFDSHSACEVLPRIESLLEFARNFVIDIDSELIEFYQVAS